MLEYGCNQNSNPAICNCTEEVFFCEEDDLWADLSST